MMSPNSFPRLISPASRRELRDDGNGCLSTVDRSEIFPVRDGIACLMDEKSIDSVKFREQELFDAHPVSGTAYFQSSFYQDVWNLLMPILPAVSRNRNAAAEMGGGEGHWSRFIRRVCPALDCYVVDLSWKSLQRAPEELIKIQADVAGPVFQRASLALISYWVSLHHLDIREQELALGEAANALDDGGILLVMEPNRNFYPRHIMYQTRMGRDVYFDGKEQAVDFERITKHVTSLGLQHLETLFVNPPYNPSFVKKLRRWRLYLPVVEMLHWMGPQLPAQATGRVSCCLKYLGLYGLAIFRKTPGETP